MLPTSQMLRKNISTNTALHQKYYLKGFITIKSKPYMLVLLPMWEAKYDKKVGEIVKKLFSIGRLSLSIV